MELCPIHKCEPVVGKHVFCPTRKVMLRDGTETTVKEIAEFVCYCPKCRGSKSYLECEAKFGYGYTSQSSASAAIANWNKACARHARRAIKDALLGK